MGSLKKTPESEDQQAQAQEKIPRQSPQEAYLAEVAGQAGAAAVPGEPPDHETRFTNETVTRADPAVAQPWMLHFTAGQAAPRRPLRHPRPQPRGAHRTRHPGFPEPCRGAHPLPDKPQPRVSRQTDRFPKAPRGRRQGRSLAGNRGRSGRAAFPSKEKKPTRPSRFSGLARRPTRNR